MARSIRRLYRSTEESRLAGVCAGLADYLEIDPVMVRLLWLLVTIFTGFVPGVVGYLVAWLIVPEEPRRAWQAGPVSPPPAREVPPS